MADASLCQIGAMLGNPPAEKAGKQPATEPAETPIGPNCEWLY